MTQPIEIGDTVSDNIRNLLSKFAAQESAFLASQFVAPKLGDGVIRVSVGGAICRMQVAPKSFVGFGVFQPTSFTQATLVREATLSERSVYLCKLPRMKVVMAGRRGTQWVAHAAHRGATPFRMASAMPVHFPSGALEFDVANVRYDYRQYWFEDLDVRHSPVMAAALRRALDEAIRPRDLQVPGMTPEMRSVYAELYRLRHDHLYARRIELSHQQDEIRRRLASNLAHAGAELVEYAEHGDGFRVTYRVDGRQHVSSIDKRDLTIQSAGFCLDDLDHEFDLASLVGVVREGQDEGLIWEDA